LNAFQVSVGEGNRAPEIMPVHSVTPYQASSKMAPNTRRDKNLLKIPNS
jgi:hypothetical protein